MGIGKVALAAVDDSLGEALVTDYLRDNPVMPPDTASGARQDVFSPLARLRDPTIQCLLKLGEDQKNRSMSFRKNGSTAFNDLANYREKSKVDQSYVNCYGDLRARPWSPLPTNNGSASLD